MARNASVDGAIPAFAQYRSTSAMMSGECFMARHIAYWQGPVNVKWQMDCPFRRREIHHMEKSIRNRIIDALDASGMTAAELARKAGVSYDVIAKLRHRPTSSTSAENAERLLAALKQPPARVENGSAAPPGARLVPVYDIQASAGDGSIIGYESVAYSLAFPPEYLRRITSSSPENLTIISVKGDSMEPTLSDDDVVMLDMSKTSLGYEGLFVIRVYDVLHVKRLSHSRPGHVLVISDNRDKYPPREYPVSDIEVVGKVLWAGGKV